MDIGLFFLGMFGAFLTIYLAKQEVIPEFRPLFDTSDKDDERRMRQDKIKGTEKEIDDVQKKLETAESLSSEEITCLKLFLETSQSERDSGIKRVQMLEREIKQGQIISRTIGFFFYIVLGGVFGLLLAGRVKVEGLSGDLPPYFQSIVIGATWTSYLSIIGFRSGQKKADERIETGLKEAAEKIDSAKKKITDVVAREVAKAEKTEKVKEPVHADEVAKTVNNILDSAGKEVQKNLNVTRQMVQQDMKGIL